MTTDQISLIKDVEAETLVDEPAAAASERPRRSRLRSWLSALALGPAGRKVLVGLTIVAVALAAGLYFLQFRPEAQTDRAAKDEVVRAASDGIVAVLTYSAETLDQVLPTAESRLTGDFLTEYTEFTRQVLTPAAQERAVTTAARVEQAAVTDIQPDSAVVLMFVNQQTMSNDRSEPSLLASTVLVTLEKVDGKWLISQFDPI